MTFIDIKLNPFAELFESRVSPHAKTLRLTYGQKIIEAYRTLVGNTGYVDIDGEWRGSHRQFLQKHFSVQHDASKRLGVIEYSPLIFARSFASLTRWLYREATTPGVLKKLIFLPLPIIALISLALNTIRYSLGLVLMIPTLLGVSIAHAWSLKKARQYKDVIEAASFDAHKDGAYVKEACSINGTDLYKTLCAASKTGVYHVSIKSDENQLVIFTDGHIPEEEPSFSYQMMVKGDSEQNKHDNDRAKSDQTPTLVDALIALNLFKLAEEVDGLNDGKEKKRLTWRNEICREFQNTAHENATVKIAKVL